MQKVKSVFCGLVSMAFTSGSAWAGVHSPALVPEPSALSIVALAAVGGIVAYRMRNKK